MSTGLRNCNRDVRVWSGRFQIFSENIRGDCGNCIHKSFSGCFFSRQNFFHRNGFQILLKSLQTFDRLSAWLTKLHPICPEEQFEVIFLKKIQSNKFFWSLNEKISEFLSKNSRQGRDIFFCGSRGTNWELFSKNFNLNLIWDFSTCFPICYLNLSVTC